MYSIGRVRSNHDYYVYMNGKYGKDRIVLLRIVLLQYMDDILIAGKNKGRIESLKSDLKRILGIDILNQKKWGVIYVSTKVLRDLAEIWYE